MNERPQMRDIKGEILERLRLKDLVYA